MRILHESVANQPKVSIIISTKNEEYKIGYTLKSLQNLDYSNYEVIIVDGGSSDRTIEIAKQLGFTKIFRQTDSTPSEGRNAGIRSSSSPIVGILDGDCIPRIDWLKNAVSLLQKENVGAVSGPWISSRYSSSISRRILNVLSTPFASFGSPVFARPTYEKEVSNFGGVGVYNKQVIEKSGLYSEALRFCEDVDLDFRIREAGYRLLYSPNVVVEHNWKVNSIKELFKHMFQYGKGRANASKKCRHLFSFFHIIPTFMFLFGIALSLFSILFGGLLGYVLISMIGVYCLLTLSASLEAAYSFRDKKMFFIAPFSYIATHFGYAIGFLFGLTTRVNKNEKSP